MENKDIDVLTYIKQVYTGFLQSKDEFCSITLGKKNAKELVDKLDYMEETLTELNDIKMYRRKECRYKFLKRL